MSVEDQVELPNNSLEPKVTQEIRMRTSNIDPEVMLQVLLQIHGQKSKLPNLLTKFYQTKKRARESMDDFSHRLNAVYEKVVAMQASQLVPLIADEPIKGRAIHKSTAKWGGTDDDEREGAAGSRDLISVDQGIFGQILE